MRLTFEKGKGGESIKWKADSKYSRSADFFIDEGKWNLQSQYSIFLICIRHALQSAYNAEKKVLFSLLLRALKSQYVDLIFMYNQTNKKKVFNWNLDHKLHNFLCTKWDHKPQEKKYSLLGRHNGNTKIL